MDTYKFMLYVGGMDFIAKETLTNVKNFCEKNLPANYSLEVVYLETEPKRAGTDMVFAIPILLKEAPLPVERIIGGITDENDLRKGVL